MSTEDASSPCTSESFAIKLVGPPSESGTPETDLMIRTNVPTSPTSPLNVLVQGK